MAEPQPNGSPRLGWIGRGWRNVREAGGVQLLGTLVVLAAALFIARFSWVLPDGVEPTPLTSEAERAFYDLRAYYAADLVAQDPRVVLVVYTDQTLIKARKRSPLCGSTVTVDVPVLSRADATGVEQDATDRVAP